MKPSDQILLLDQNPFVTAFKLAGVYRGEVNTVRLPMPEIQRQLVDMLSITKQAEKVGLTYLGVTNDSHRENIEDLSNPRLRNIKSNSARVAEILTRRPAKHRDDKKELRMDDFEKLIKTIMRGARKEMGLPEENVAEYAYAVTSAVLNATDTEEVRKHLEQVSNDGPVTSAALPNVLAEIQNLDPSGYAAVEQALLAEKTRSYLSAMAITDTGHGMGVSIANPQGRQLRLTGRRFELLLEKPDTTRSLGEFLRDVPKGGSHQTYINTTTQSGEVMARYVPKTSTLQTCVICARKGEVVDAADFILDADAVVCTYLAVKRLRQDYSRFVALCDEAGSRVAFDPFMS